MITMMVKVDKKELEYLIEEHMNHTPCNRCDCYYSGLCNGEDIPEGGCTACYLKYLQIDQEKS